MSKTKELPKDFFVPRRRGAIYCSRGCGRLCTFAEYQRAVAVADKLARTMGRGWKPKVWENLGWHASASDAAGVVRVYTVFSRGAGGPMKYHCLVGENGSGRAEWTPSTGRSFTDPLKAARAAVQCAVDVHAETTRLVDRAVAAVGLKQKKQGAATHARL